MLNNNKKQETQFFGTKCGNANSIAAGYATETTNYGEIATGILNKSTKGDNPNSPEGIVGDPKATLFSVGCGTKEERKNALEVKGDGSVIISGKDGSDVNIADLVEKLDQPIIENFGAIGDGIVDDTEAFKSAMKLGHVVSLTANKTYAIKSSLILNDITIHLNGAKLLLSETLRIEKNVDIIGGTIEGKDINSFHNPYIIINEKNNSLEKINFQANYEGVYYIVTTNNAENTKIVNCNFDKNCKVAIRISGIYTFISNCNFEAHTEVDLYSNCIKLCAYSVDYDDIPNPKYVSIHDCYFGKTSDNIIDCFTGVDNMYVSNCIFEQMDTAYAVEIKDIFRKEGEVDSYGTSIENIRINKNIVFENCIFLGNAISCSSNNRIDDKITYLEGIRLQKCYFNANALTTVNCKGIEIIECIGTNSTINIKNTEIKIVLTKFKSGVFSESSNVKIKSCDAISFNFTKSSSAYISKSSGDVIVYDADTIIVDGIVSNGTRIVAQNGTTPCNILIIKNCIGKKLLTNSKLSPTKCIIINNLYSSTIADKIDDISINENNHKII